MLGEMSDTMTYGQLGRSGLLVSRLGLGTMNFGYLADEASSLSVMDAAFDAGIILFDTADVYGGPQSPGHGQDLRHLGTNRWAVAGAQWAPGRHRLATKVYQSMGPGPNERRLSAYHIRRACEASLRRLQTDHIDLYQMHHVDRATPWEEVVPALRHLGIGLIPYSPLHAGLLTGALEAEAQGQLSPGQLPRVDAHRDQLR